jgi:hypothetical protein
VCFSSCLRQGTLYPLLAQGFCVREAVAVNTRNIRAKRAAHGRERGKSATLIRSRTGRGRKQSVSAFSPRKQTRPRTGRVLGNAAASTVREPAAATDSNCPQPVRSRELSTSPNWSRAQSVREHGPATNCPRRCIAVSILPPIIFPVHIRITPAYDLV